MTRFRVAASVVLVASLSSCRSELDEEAQVAAAIVRLRDLPPRPIEARRAAASTLSDLPVRSGRASAARDACAKAYRALDDANELTDEVERAMSATQPEQRADPRLLAAKLRQADELLEASREGMRRCDEATRELRAVR